MTVEYSFLFRLRKIDNNFIRFIMIIALRLKTQKKKQLISFGNSADYRILSENYSTHKKVGFTYNFIFLSIKLNFIISE